MENLKYEMFSIMYADLKIGKTIKLRRIKLNKKFPDITKKKKKIKIWVIETARATGIIANPRGVK